jgi:DNA-binding PucR family transcriptional regulator
LRRKKKERRGGRKKKRKQPPVVNPASTARDTHSTEIERAHMLSVLFISLHSLEHLQQLPFPQSNYHIGGVASKKLAPTAPQSHPH